MKDLRQEYIADILALDGDVEGRRAALDFIESSDVTAHGEPAPFPYVPYLFDDDDVAGIFADMRIAHRILCKVIRRFLDDPGYREIFHFSSEAERLILLPCGYDQLLPMGRFDIFLSEDDGGYKFCEFNTDGSGAMSRDLMIGRALMQGGAFERFASKHDVEQFELFDSWAAAFMRIYESDPGCVSNPTICIADFRESGVFSDFNRFIQAFERAGASARFVDVRDFKFDGESLIDPSDGTVINAVYRRAVTSEILQHPGECDALIDAVAAQKVCLIGHFRTTVAHSKMINVALFDKRTAEFLTPKELAFVERHVPRTYRLASQCPAPESTGPNIAELKAGKDRWIIKPEDDYGSHGVHPGVDCSQEEWEKLVDASLDCGCIVQEFCNPPLVDVMETRIDELNPCSVTSWKSMPGIYIYDGEPVGFYCRLGREAVIAIDHGGLCSCSFRVRS